MDLHKEAERLARDLERFDSLNIRKQAAETLRSLSARLAEMERERYAIAAAKTARAALDQDQDQDNSPSAGTETGEKE